MVIQLVREENSDLLLIAGDLFDNNRVGEAVVLPVLEMLSQLPIPCVIVPGNHDALDGSSVYRTFDFEKALPGVRVIKSSGGQLVEFEELDMTVWGRPVISHEPSFQPLAGVHARASTKWYVVMGHGHYLGADRSVFAQGMSSPISDADLELCGADYVALGHWEVTASVGDGNGPPAWYSGSPVVAGQPRSALLVTLDPQTGVSVDCHGLKRPSCASQ